MTLNVYGHCRALVQSSRPSLTMPVGALPRRARRKTDATPRFGSDFFDAVGKLFKREVVEEIFLEIDNANLTAQQKGGAFYDGR